MKYNVGDKLVFDMYGTLKECEVVVALENTGRYRVKYPSEWMTGKDTIELRKEHELFLTTNDLIDSKINDLRVRIGYLQADIQKWEQKRTQD